MSSRYCDTTVDAQRLTATGFVATLDQNGRTCYTAPSVTAPGMPALNTRAVYPYCAPNDPLIPRPTVPRQTYQTPECLLRPTAYSTQDAIAVDLLMADRRERFANHHTLGGRGLIAGAIPGRSGIPYGGSLDGVGGVGMAQRFPSSARDVQSTKTFATLPIGRMGASYERSALPSLGEVERERAITGGGFLNRPQAFRTPVDIHTRMRSSQTHPPPFIRRDGKNWERPPPPISYGEAPKRTTPKSILKKLRTGVGGWAARPSLRMREKAVRFSVIVNDEVERNGPVFGHEDILSVLDEVDPLPEPLDGTKPSDYSVVGGWPGAMICIYESEPGSKEAMERRKNVKEAKVTIAWLEEEHPLWIDRVANDSGLTRHAYLHSIGEYFTDLGADACAGPRRAVQSYERWADRNRDSVLVAYPPTPAVISLYLRDMTATARKEAERLNREFKGEAAKGRCKALKSAAHIYGAPFGFIDESNMVRVAWHAPEMANVLREEAHQSLFSACHFEQMACSHELFVSNHTQWLYAVAFALLPLATLRSIEGARARAVELTPKYLQLHVSGGKASSRLLSKPFEVYIPVEGFIPRNGEMMPFLPVWFLEMKGKPFIFPEFKAERGTGGLVTHAFLNQAYTRVAAAPVITQQWGCLCGIMPLAYSPHAMKENKATERGPRHLLPDIARTGGYQREDRKELGRWAIPLDLEENTDAARARFVRLTSRPVCTELYSTGSAERDRQLSVRTAILSDVREFIGDQPWQNIVPRQVNAKPEFGFIYDTRPTVAVAIMVTERSTDSIL